MLDEVGVGVSTARVAQQAGVSNGTLFNYFPTKQRLLDAVYLHLKHDVMGAIGEVDDHASNRDKLATVWRAWTGWAVEHPQRHRVMLLLNGAGVITADAADAAVNLMAPLWAILTDLDEEHQLADVPLPHIGALLQSQLELAVTSGLTPSQRERAFTMAWRSITTDQSPR